MLELARHAARSAGEILYDAYGKKHAIHHKGLRDITTEADYAAEDAAIRIISAGCAGAQFMTEETHHAVIEPGDAPLWLIDPLDGTTNYARGLPEFSISIAMVRNGEIQVGVVYEPMTGQMFYASRGQGAYLNERQLRVSTRSIADALVQQDWPRQPEPRRRMAELVQAFAPYVDCIRSSGSAALGFCAVAAGWADIYVQLTLQPWDVAAGLLILEEAGGRATALDGTKYNLFQPDWLATNGLIHQQCIEIARNQISTLSSGR